MFNRPLNPFISTNAIVFLERVAFFLFITHIYQHLTSDDVRLHPNDTVELLALFINGAVFSRIFGGLLVDFVTGTKLALLIGLSLQLLGVLMLTTTNINVIYYGMIPYALGQALIMPAILKRNALNFPQENPRLIAMNYSTFLSIVLAAVLVSFIPVTRQYGMQQADISLTMIFLPLLIALVLAVFTKGNLGKDLREIDQVEEEGGNSRSGLILGVSIIALILFYFAIKAVSGKLNISDNMLNNLQTLQGNKYMPKYVLFGYILICTLPAITLVVLGFIKRMNPLLIVGIGFSIALISLLSFYLLMQKQINVPFLYIACMALYLMQEGLITPALVTAVQRNTPYRFTATVIGICIAFTGFLSGYFAEKIIEPETLQFYGRLDNSSFTGLFTALGIFMVFATVFLILWIRPNGEKRNERFEDVDHL